MEDFLNKVTFNIVNVNPIKSVTLRVIKHEFKHKDKLNNNMDVDTAATKRLYERLARKFTDSDHIIGFVHDHMHDPFGCLLISQLQVNALGSVHL